ncbi:MAG: M23 family metallopeptidase [Tannerella sp.]|jgi:lipoprotein NlpD|nr:M23 family metallopeptidase [Tannerella sp.]
MNMVKKQRHAKSLWNRIRFKYKLLFFNESTLEEVWSFRLSQLSVIVYFGLFAFALIALTSIIIILTPIRNYLPGYLDVEVREEILKNAMTADSLKEKIDIQSRYLENLTAILAGEISIDSIQNTDDTLSFIASNYEIARSDRELAYIERFEEEEKYKINTLNPESGELVFHKPLKGVISSAFRDDKTHLGIDLTAAEATKVLATLDGTVVYAGFDNNLGNIITLQHENDFISMYMHNDKLLKKIGDHVITGEAIAVIGNTGKLSSGTHLHFEIWHRGEPVDPSKFIHF